MRISAIIVTKGRPAMLAETLASLADCEPLPDELIVVDGDPDQSARAIAAELDARAVLPVRYVSSEPGLTHQRNVGVRAASGDVLVFADDDVDFDPRTFSELASAFADPAVVGATGRVIEPEGRRFGRRESRLRALLHVGGAEGTMARYGYPRRIIHAEIPRDVEFMHGCLMSARADAARAVPFDEHLTGYGLAEDEDFSYRLSRHGRLRYVPAAAVVHKSTGFRSHGAYEFNRMVALNRSYLFRKNFEQGIVARLQFALLLLGLVAHRAANREWAGVRGLVSGAREAWSRS